jgi:hypothetical protein
MAGAIARLGKAQKLVAESEIVRSERNKLYFELIMEARKEHTIVDYERIHAIQKKLYLRSRNLATEAKIYWKTVYGSAVDPKHPICQMWTKPVNSLTEIENIFIGHNLTSEELFVLIKLVKIEETHWFR